MKSVYEYLENKTNKEVADAVSSKLELDNDKLQWKNASTNTVLSNEDYCKKVIDEAIESWNENKEDNIEDGITESDTIISFFESEEDFTAVEVSMTKLEFVEDEENYEVRVVDGDDYEVAGELVKDEDGTWCFNYEDQSVAYEDSLEETEDDLRDEFESGKTDDMAHSFGSYSYEK